MPQTTVLAFRSKNGKVPLLEWLRELNKKNKRAYAKCLERILRLSTFGNELKRPLAAPLRDGILELRVRSGTEQYRMLYFFHGKDTVVLSHGLQKESEVPDSEIKNAIANRRLVKCNKKLYTTDLEGDDVKSDEVD